MKKIYFAAPLFNEMELKRNKEISENCVFHKKELLLISKKIKKNIIIFYDDIELELGIVTVLNNELKK